MNSFISRVTDSFNLILSMSPADVVDVLIVAVAVYAVAGFIRKTNSVRFAQGILLLLVALWLSSIAQLTVTTFLLRQVFEIGVLAVVILFQPEIRRALERVGSYRFFSLFGRSVGGQAVDRAIMQTVNACQDMSKSRTGALIVFERANHLNETMVSGTPVDAIVTSELLKNIFFNKSPLHDGAVIIRDGRLAAAGCVLPLSESANLSKDLGMRHRAGIGMSERSDAVVVIVSEETGAISVAQDGLLKRHLSADTFESLLRQELLPQEKPERSGLLDRLARRKGNANEK